MVHPCSKCVEIDLEAISVERNEVLVTANGIPFRNARWLVPNLQTIKWFQWSTEVAYRS